MNYMKMKGILCTILVIFLASCSAPKFNTFLISDEAPVIVYKTILDYTENVPVLLNDEKNRIVSYPAPADLFHEGELALPVKLSRGYLLDRRGIGANTAFTSYTFDEYSRMKAPPSLQDLNDHIIDKNPFEAMYQCGKRGDYSDLTKELKQKIRKGMSGCNNIINR